MAAADENLRCIAVLGWQDQPVDAVQEYCEYLGAAFPQQGLSFELFRVRWPEIGWPAALRELRELARDANGAWFLVQYTALTWSRRGFSHRVLKVIRTIQAQGGKCAVVFHDSEGYPGGRLIDKIRRSVQLYTMRKALRLADVAILNIPIDQSSWLPANASNAIFIPVGANLPSPEKAWQPKRASATKLPTVGVFSLSAGPSGEEEVQAISQAVRYAAEKLGQLRLTVLGRNSASAGAQLKEQLSGTSVRVDVLGLLQPNEIVQVLGSCDALLFARGPITTRRGSAIAGIACGLPVIACQGPETAPVLLEAGLDLVPDSSGFGSALLLLLGDSAYRASLAERSRSAQQRYFSWSVIAAQFAAALRHPPSPH